MYCMILLLHISNYGCRSVSDREAATGSAGSGADAGATDDGAETDQKVCEFRPEMFQFAVHGSPGR